MGKPNDELQDMNLAETPQPQNSFCEHEQQKTPEEQMKLCENCKRKMSCPLGHNLRSCNECENRLPCFKEEIQTVLNLKKYMAMPFFKNQVL